MHADVHELIWIAGPGGAAPQLWVACDGGVFRSAKDGERHSFEARNTGLASLEAQYLAQHPRSDAVLFVGTQDNGTIRPVGAETWTVASKGDGGGTAIDPRDPRRVIAQYTYSDYYRSTDGGESFHAIRLFRKPPSTAGFSVRKAYQEAQKTEHDASSFYCGVAAIDTGTVMRLAVGTDRVWLSTDWGDSWVTLPTALDPYDPATPGAPNRTQDKLPGDGATVSLRWASPDVLWAATADGIHRFAFAAGAWTRTVRYDRVAVAAIVAGGAPPPAGQIPPDLPVTDLAPHDPARGPHGSLYATTSGVGGQHVWWFDGTATWIPTGLLVDTPAHAVTVDPDHHDVLYVGTDVGVWKGEGTFPPGGAPSWTWDPYANGLPEAAVIDLAVHAPTRLLRAALRGRGVWELALDGVEQGPEVYLRAHAYDTRRRPVPAAGAADPLGDPDAPPVLRLDASPDLRVQRAPGADPAPAPITLPLNETSNPFDVWLLQAARRVDGKRLKVDGLWSAQSLEAMKPIPATEAEWQAAVGGARANRFPYDNDPPDAADIAFNFRDEPDRKAGPTASCVTGDGQVRIHVTLHSRHWEPVGRGARLGLRPEDAVRWRPKPCRDPGAAGWLGRRARGRHGEGAGPARRVDPRGLAVVLRGCGAYGAVLPACPGAGRAPGRHARPGARGRPGGLAADGLAATRRLPLRRGQAQHDRDRRRDAGANVAARGRPLRPARRLTEERTPDVRDHRPARRRRHRPRAPQRKPATEGRGACRRCGRRDRHGSNGAQRRARDQPRLPRTGRRPDRCGGADDARRRLGAAPERARLSISGARSTSDPGAAPPTKSRPLPSPRRQPKARSTKSLRRHSLGRTAFHRRLEIAYRMLDVESRHCASLVA